MSTLLYVQQSAIETAAEQITIDTLEGRYGSVDSFVWTDHGPDLFDEIVAAMRDEIAQIVEVYTDHGHALFVHSTNFTCTESVIDAAADAVTGTF